MLAFSVIIVITIWRVLAFVHDHIADIRVGRKIGTIAATALAAIAVVSPPTFAAGTTRYIDQEAQQMAAWLTESIRTVLQPDEASPPPEDAPADISP